MFKLDINTKAVVALTNKLEKISKQALPKAVRHALNQTAFDVKTKTMPKMAGDTFVKRSPNFLTANSKVLTASGNDLRKMKSTVGFTSEKLQGGKTNFAVRDLEQQENGGKIGGRNFIPTDLSRTAKSNKNMVKSDLRLSKFKDMPSISDADGDNWSEKAIKTALHVGVGGYALNTSGRWGSILKITSIRRRLSNNKKSTKARKGKGLKRGKASGTVFKKQILYTYDKNRNVKPKATHFMRRSSLESAKKMEKFYFEEAKKLIAKL